MRYIRVRLHECYLSIFLGWLPWCANHIHTWLAHTMHLCCKWIIWTSHPVCSFNLISFSKFFYSIFGSRTIEFVSWNVPFKWGHEKLQILLEAWEASKGEWSSSQLYKTITQRKTTTCHGARVWLTRTQIASKYQDQSIADCICDAKLADKELAASQTKWHPDGVGIEARWYRWYGFGKSRH